MKEKIKGLGLEKINGLSLIVSAASLALGVVSAVLGGAGNELTIEAEINEALEKRGL